MSGRDRRAGAAGPPVSRDARPREMGRVATGPVCDGDGASFLDPAVPRLRNPPRRDGPLHRGSTPGGAGTASKDTKSPVSDILDLMNPEVIARLRHTLRTPLNHIIGYAEMVRDEAHEQRAEAEAGFMDRVLAAARHVVERVQEALPVKAHIPQDAVPGLRESIRASLGEIEKSLKAFEELSGGACDKEMRKMRAAMRELQEFSSGAEPERTIPVPL